MRRTLLAISTLLAVTSLALVPRPASAQTPPFRAALDREAAVPGEPFAYEVTLTIADEPFEGFRPPEFKGLQVLQAPAAPNRSMSVQMGGGATRVENRLSWRWELALPANAKSPVTIGAARVRVNGHNVASNSVQVRIGAPGTGQASRSGGSRVGGGLFPGGLPGFLDGDDATENQVASSPGGAFIRAVANKTRVFVGEQVNVSWLLYLTEPQNNFRPIAQPGTDGFWSEDLPSTNPQGRLAFVDRVEGGRTYQVALLQSKALFPLAPGKLTVTSMEAEVAKTDFFGRAVRGRHLKSDPLTIEAVALPREGQPARFPAGNVGRYEVRAAADRASVAVGDAVTVTVTAKGAGNLRNLELPALPKLEGWKSYEPKTDVQVDLGDNVTGTKTVEWLIRPERPGKTTVPALALATFDPTTRRYLELKTDPIDLVVAGEGAPVAGGNGPAAAPVSPAADNSIAATIRPIRVRDRPGREVASFLSGPAFTATLALPPLGFAALTVAARVRRRLGAGSAGSRRRRLRLAARRRLRQAEAHRAAGRTVPFYVEIDRVLREALADRLGVPVGGLTLDELNELLAARGLPRDQVTRVIAALEACDRARFSPGGQAETPETSAIAEALSAALVEAEEIFDIVDRAELTPRVGRGT